jgi:hypothetical protein
MVVPFSQSVYITCSTSVSLNEAVDDRSLVVTASDLGFHGHGTAWFVCDVRSPVSVVSGGWLARELCVIVSYDRTFYSR